MSMGCARGCSCLLGNKTCQIQPVNDEEKNCRVKGFASIHLPLAPPLRVSVVGVAAEVHVCRRMADDTGGTYAVALGGSHLEELMLTHAPPPPASAASAGAQLVRGSRQGHCVGRWMGHSSPCTSIHPWLRRYLWRASPCCRSHLSTPTPLSCAAQVRMGFPQYSAEAPSPQQAPSHPLSSML